MLGQNELDIPLGEIFEMLPRKSLAVYRFPAPSNANPERSSGLGEVMTVAKVVICPSGVIFRIDACDPT